MMDTHYHKQLEEKIRELEQTETALKESEEKYRLLFLHSKDIIYAIDHQLVLTTVSPSVENILGYKPEELIGRPFPELNILAPESLEPAFLDTMKILSGESISSARYEFIAKDGSKKIGDVSGAPIFKDGKVISIISIARDITKREQSEIQLKQSHEQLIEGQQKLIKNEALFRGLFDHMTSGSAIYEVTGNGSKGSDYIIKNFNRTSLQIEEKTLEQVIGKSLSDLRPNIDDYGLIPVMKKVWESGEPAEFPVKIYNDDKFSNYYENYIFKLPTGEVVTIYNDVTEQKNTEIELKESEEKFKAIFDNAIDGILVADAFTKKFLMANTVMCRMSGYTREELLDLSVFDLHPKEDLTAVLDAFESQAGNEFLVAENIPVLRKDGSVFYADINSSPIAVRSETYLVGIFRDISDRKKTEEALRESEARYRAYVDNSPVGIFVADATARFIDTNPAACSMLGYTREELLTFSIPDLNKELPDNLHNNDFQTLKETGFLHTERKLLKKNGTLLTVDLRAVALGENRFMALWSDLTERKRLESQLRQAQKLEAIGTLAGGIAHDFNNILSSMIGFTELAIEDAEKETPMEEYLQEIFIAGKRARDLVKQILAFARQSEEEMKPLQVDKIGKETLKLLRASLPVTIKINQEFESTSVIRANATQIHQIFMNLCTNAAHAMEASGGILTVGLIDTKIMKDTAGMPAGLPDGNYLKLTVSDTGTGIPPEIMESIFEPYFTTKETGEGSGMGLALIHGIVEAHEGKIFAESRPGKGSVFSVYLPTIKQREADLQKNEEKLPTGNERILLVDDESPIAKMGKQILERLGYRVTIRTSSVEALELFRAMPLDFDLVITDMTMPNMTGDTLAAELIMIRPDIPVILCTGYSNKLSEKTAASIGIRAIAHKPVVKAELAKTIRKVLDDKKVNSED